MPEIAPVSNHFTAVTAACEIFDANLRKYKTWCLAFHVNAAMRSVWLFKHACQEWSKEWI